MGSGFHNQNYSEIKKSYFKIPCSNDLKYLKWKLSNFLKLLFFPRKIWTIKAWGGMEEGSLTLVIRPLKMQFIFLSVFLRSMNYLGYHWICFYKNTVHSVSLYLSTPVFFVQCRNFRKCFFTISNDTHSCSQTVGALSQWKWNEVKFELNVVKCQINTNSYKNVFLFPTKCVEEVTDHAISMNFLKYLVNCRVFAKNYNHNQQSTK